MGISQEQIDKLPLISLDEFEGKVVEFKKTNLVLQKHHGGWQSLPPHLLKHLFVKIGAKPIVNKY